MLRPIFSRLGEPYVGPSSMFSVNDPQGMSPECEGMGRVSTVDVDAMVDRSLSLNEGAIDVVAAADWVIDMGPGPGHDGGEIVFAGPPRALLDAEGSVTGQHLAERLAAA